MDLFSVYHPLGLFVAGLFSLRFKFPCFSPSCKNFLFDPSGHSNFVELDMS
jgi:hypothetical protein